jgi:hypothetical protein
MFLMRYELGFHIPEDDILHSHIRENLKSYKIKLVFQYLFSSSFGVTGAINPQITSCILGYEVS